MIRRTLLSLTLLLALTPLALAQRLADLLPAETLLALGAEGLNDNADLLDTFIDEFQRLGVGEALQAVFGDAIEENSDQELEVPPELADLDVLDVLGQEAWVGVSATPFNPLPAIILLTRTSPRATDAFASLLANHIATEEVESLQESGFTFYQEIVDGGDTPFNAVAYAQAGDVLALSSNPETLRGVLRRLGGNGEASFTGGAGYAGTLGQLGSGSLYGYLDLPQVIALAAPFGQGFGFDSAVTRLTTAFNTAGVNGGVMRIVADGIEGESIAALDASGGDSTLFNLLTGPFSAGTDALTFAPASALSITNSYVDLGGWRNYLNEIVAAVPEIGLSSLDEAFMMFGLDLGTTFFDWAGTRVATVTTGVTAAVEPGVAPENLLGEAVYLIDTFDEVAAQAGLAQFFGTASGLVASFADPSGGGGFVPPATRQVGNVTITSYAVTDGVELSYAVAGGYALIATSDDAMDTVLAAFASGGLLSPAFGALLAQIPDNARGFTLTDNRASTAATASTLASQIQLTAGLSGGANLDFDAVTEATKRIETFLLFVAERLGGSYSYSTSDGGSIRSFSRSEVAW